MKKMLFITRHTGAQQWALNHNLADSVQIVPHFDGTVPADIDIVAGILPVNLAAAVCEQGAEFWSLDINLPAELRGKELTEQQMNEYGAKLTRYHVGRVS